jgi:hypothetical protein
MEDSAVIEARHRRGVSLRDRSDGARLSSSERAVEPLTVSADRLDYPVRKPALTKDISLDTWTKVKFAVEHRHLLSTHF